MTMKQPPKMTSPKTTSQKFSIRGQELPNSQREGVYIIYTPFPFVRFFGSLPHPLTSPFLGVWEEFGRKGFLTAALIVAGVFPAGARLTAPNYDPTFCPTWETSVNRTRVSPFPVLGFSLETMKMNKTTETTSPRPWKIISRETKATKTCHHKSHTYVLVDANGREVWHTLANMRLICDAVNEKC